MINLSRLEEIRDLRTARPLDVAVQNLGRPETLLLFKRTGDILFRSKKYYTPCASSINSSFSSSAPSTPFTLLIRRSTS